MVGSQMVSLFRRVPGIHDASEMNAYVISKTSDIRDLQDTDESWDDLKELYRQALI